MKFLFHNKIELKYKNKNYLFFNTMLNSVFDKLKNLVPEQYAVHWQETLRFLQIITQYWPQILKERQVVDAAERKNILLAAQAEIWADSPPPEKIIAAGGSCCVHDKYQPHDVEKLRAQYPGIKVVAHPECPIEVCRLCDYVGSTKGMTAYVAGSDAETFGMLTEFGLVNRLEAEFPQKKFVWPFGVCRSMKRNTLQNTLEALIDPRPEQVVEVAPAVAAEAKKAIDKMFELAQ